MKSPTQKIVDIPISDLKPWKTNPRKHSAEHVAQIAAAIKQWGWTIPVLIDRHRNIIAGHGRVLAAKSLGKKVVPCLFRRGKWSEAQVRAYIIADNKLTENAGWDSDLLRLEFSNLQKLGFDMKLTGFAMNDIAGLLDLGKGDDPSDHWQGMPEFEQPEQAHRSIIIHFQGEADVKKFAQLVGQKVTEKTKFLWFPPLADESYTDQEWASEA